MRKVIDSNYLRSERLRDYLEHSRNNYAVISDYAAMEAYKDNPIDSIQRSMKVLCDYPQQVIVLKSTTAICGLRGRPAGLQRRLIDTDQTRGFGGYCRTLELARTGNMAVRNAIAEHGEVASAHLALMLRDADGLPSVFGDIAETYDESEIRLIRKHEPFTDSIAEKMLASIFMIAGQFFRDHPKVNKIPSSEELHNTFIFRFSLCTYLMVLDWITVGGTPNIRSDKVRNDLVDLNFAALATYFDGILTADKKLSAVYEEACIVLEILFE